MAPKPKWTKHPAYTRDPVWELKLTGQPSAVAPKASAPMPKAPVSHGMTAHDYVLYVQRFGKSWTYAILGPEAIEGARQLSASTLAGAQAEALVKAHKDLAEKYKPLEDALGYLHRLLLGC